MKLSISRIVLDHYKTFYDYRTKKTSINDYIVQVALPIIMGVGVGFFLKVNIDDGFANIIITSLSIFAGLLLNLLILIYTVSRSTKDDEVKAKLFLELIANISYGILVAIIMLGLVILIRIAEELGKQDINWATCVEYFGIVLWILLGQFVLTLFMILKRVYVVLKS